jgi:hypothetical protein
MWKSHYFLSIEIIVKNITKIYIIDSILLNSPINEKPMILQLIRLFDYDTINETKTNDITNTLKFIALGDTESGLVNNKTNTIYTSLENDNFIAVLDWVCAYQEGVLILRYSLPFEGCKFK